MKKPIIFAVPVALVLLAAGYFFLLPLLKGSPAAALDEEGDPVAEVSAKPAIKKKKVAEPGLIYPMADRVFNLASGPGGPGYARIELALEFEKPPPTAAKSAPKEGAPAKEGAAKTGAEPLDPALEPVVARKAQIDDAVVKIVGSKTKEMMISAEGKDALKLEIMDAVTTIVPTMDIIAVYIVRLVVQ